MVNALHGWIIFFSFLISLMLSVLPFPVGLQWIWPAWVPLVLIYWCMTFPDRVGLGIAWIIGLLLDLLQGSYLGVNALALLVVAYATHLLYRRLRMYRLLQQALVILFLVTLNQLISQWPQGFSGFNIRDLMFLIPSLASALVWPWLLVILRSLRCGAWIN